MAGTKRRGDVASLIFIYLWPPSDLYTGTSIDYALIRHENKKNSLKKPQLAIMTKDRNRMVNLA